MPLDLNLAGVFQCRECVFCVEMVDGEGGGLEKERKGGFLLNLCFGVV